MSRPLRRAAGLLLAAACTQNAPPPAAVSGAAAPAEVAAAPASAARATVPPAVATLVRAEPPPQPGRGGGRPSPCLETRQAAATSLATEARAAAERGQLDRALACADEALRARPRLVPALAARAEALAALGRTDDARLAFARALAVDPDDPRALAGAAELYVRRMGGAREALETGLEYALRARDVLGKAGPREGELAGRLELVAGMAENDLGRSHLALGHLDRAVAARPRDPDALYERGVALYELCRFEEAQRAFDRALQLAPEDPWTLHQLGLLAERRGEVEHAERLFLRARALAPGEFRAEPRLDAAGFRALVEREVKALPEHERAALALAPIEIAELPDEEDLLAVDPPLSPSILGLFRGPSEHEPCGLDEEPAAAAAAPARCRSIVFYRKNLLRFARDAQDLAEQVRVTLLHELGHLHGETDDELRERGLE